MSVTSPSGAPKNDPPHKERTLNYVTTNRFFVEIEGLIKAGFTECSGPGQTIKKEVYFEGGVNDQQRVRLGHAEFADITLKRGLTDNLDFWDWASQASKIRKNVNILLFNQSGEVMQSWTLIGAIPVGWKAPAMQADGNSVAIEELTLAYEGLNIQKARSASESHVKRDQKGFF